MQGQKVLLEKTGSQLGEQELPDFQLQTPRRYPRETCLEEPSQAGPQGAPLLQVGKPRLSEVPHLVRRAE